MTLVRLDSLNSLIEPMLSYGEKHCSLLIPKIGKRRGGAWFEVLRAALADVEKLAERNDTEALTNQWVPLSKCPNLAPGQYVVELGSQDCVAPLVALSTRSPSGLWSWNHHVRSVLNPERGPIPATEAQPLRRSPQCCGAPMDVDAFSKGNPYTCRSCHRTSFKKDGS